jgi:hypothetical protein
LPEPREVPSPQFSSQPVKEKGSYSINGVRRTRRSKDNSNKELLRINSGSSEPNSRDHNDRNGAIAIKIEIKSPLAINFELNNADNEKKTIPLI